MKRGQEAAFPRSAGPYIQGEGLTNDAEFGMTIRQYYKATALAGMIEKSAKFSEFGFKEQHIDLAKEFAKRAGYYADAMVAEDLEHESKP